MGRWSPRAGATPRGRPEGAPPPRGGKIPPRSLRPPEAPGRAHTIGAWSRRELGRVVTSALRNLRFRWAHRRSIPACRLRGQGIRSSPSWGQVTMMATRQLRAAPRAPGGRAGWPYPSPAGGDDHEPVDPARAIEQRGCSAPSPAVPRSDRPADVAAALGPGHPLGGGRAGGGGARPHPDRPRRPRPPASARTWRRGLPPLSRRADPVLGSGSPGPVRPGRPGPGGPVRW